MPGWLVNAVTQTELDLKSGGTGYSLIQADCLDDATTKAEGCPVLANGGSVEIGECIEIAM